MPRSIVLCFDGTNNEYAATNTNVVKLYAMLDRTKSDQIAYCQPGIGTYAPPGHGAGARREALKVGLLTQGNEELTAFAWNIFKRQRNPAISPKAAAPSVAAPQRESLRGLWWLAEFIPKPFRDPGKDFTPRRVIHAGRPRHVAERSHLHVSVLERQRQSATYRPTNIPTQFVEVQ